MDIKELRDKSQTELERLLAEARNRLREMRFGLASRQLAGVRQVRETKKTIARILTIRKQGEGKPGTAAKGDSTAPAQPTQG